MPISQMDGSATISTTEFSFPANANYSSGSPQTDANVMQAFADLNALAAGDQFRLRVYDKINAGTQRVIFEATVTGAQNPPIFVFPSLIVHDGWDVTILKLVGTDRAVPWSVKKIT